MKHKVVDRTTSKCFRQSTLFLSYSQKFDKKIEDLINENLDETIELRHWFHQNAELSNREFKTAARIAEELKKIGYEPMTGIAKTGVVAILNPGKPGPVVVVYPGAHLQLDPGSG